MNATLWLIWMHKKMFAVALGCAPFDDIELQRISVLKHRVAFSIGCFFGGLDQLSKACNQAADAMNKLADTWRNLDLEELEDKDGTV